MYESPRISTVGSVPALTLGEGIRGKDDWAIFFFYGTDPKPSDPPVGS